MRTGSQSVLQPHQTQKNSNRWAGATDRTLCPFGNLRIWDIETVVEVCLFFGKIELLFDKLKKIN
jgi:hypothetical protein